MRKFNEKYEVIEDKNKTKAKILLCAVRLFALRGYDTVNMKQIASELQIQPGAIYNHYVSKEAILDCILDQTSELLDMYYQVLEESNRKAESFEEIVDNMYAELIHTTSEFTYYGLTIAQNTQFVHEKSQRLYCDKYIIYGHEVMKRQFDIAVEKGFLEPFDTRALACFYGGSVIALTQVKAGKFNGFYEGFDVLEWFRREKELILSITRRLPDKIAK